MNSIANVQTTNRQVNQLQQNIGQAVAPVINNPISNGLILSNQKLVSSNNIINHGLGRTLQGWFVVRYHGSWAQIYDNQDTNTQPSKTLLLNSNAQVTVDLYVF